MQIQLWPRLPTGKICVAFVVVRVQAELASEIDVSEEKSPGALHSFHESPSVE